MQLPAVPGGDRAAVSPPFPGPPVDPDDPARLRIVEPLRDQPRELLTLLRLRQRTRPTAPHRNPRTYRVLRRPLETAATNLTTRSFCPGASTVAALTRPPSPNDRDSTRTGAGQSMRCSIAAPTRSPMRLVRCTSVTAIPEASWYSPLSGSSSTAATRGSASADGSCSLVSSSDCTAIRAWPSTGSTS